MYLKAIHLKQFRNISDLSLSLHPKCNLLVGNNAQGKTNVVEATYLLSFGKSFRVQDYKDLIAWGAQQSYIRSFVFNEIGDEERSVELTQEKKKFFKNGKPVSANQFLSIPMVLFAPEAILLLKESPQARRDYIDHLITKCFPPYGDRLKNYKTALAHRNKILKEELLSPEEKRNQMELWERPMCEHGCYLIQERRKWTERLNEFIKKNYAQIAGSGPIASFIYQPNVFEEEWPNRQMERREEEIERGVSLVGPHRDDFQAQLDEKSIKNFGSQGENRTFILALKLSEMALFEEVLGFSPILLLDDVVSELDEKRNDFFFNHLKNFKGQIFATATTLNLFPKTTLNNYNVWTLKEGLATPI